MLEDFRERVRGGKGVEGTGDVHEQGTLTRQPVGFPLDDSDHSNDLEYKPRKSIQLNIPFHSLKLPGVIQIQQDNILSKLDQSKITPQHTSHPKHTPHNHNKYTINTFANNSQSTHQ